MTKLIERLVDRLYGKPLIRNVLRGELVEQVLCDALGPQWSFGEDYAEADLLHVDGTKLQVKQSAARQSWHEVEATASSPRFSIAPGLAWCASSERWLGPPKRQCQIYVFAWHPLTGGNADHRCAAQWRFYVASAASLPDQKSVGLGALAKLTAERDLQGAAAAIEAIRQG